MIELPKKTYSVKSIRDTIYWMSKDYAMILDENTSHYLINCGEFTADFKKDFLMKVNDFQLRNEIEVQTKEIKSLIAAKAFYPEIVKFKDVGDFDDPVLIERRNAETEHKEKF